MGGIYPGRERSDEQPQTAEEIKKNLIYELSWRVAERDDRRVAQVIHEGEELDGGTA